MYDPVVLQSKFAGLVGFMQFNDPQYPLLPTPLLQSSSHLYIQNVHPLTELEVVWQCAPAFNKYEYPEWVDGPYAEGSLVYYPLDQKIYVAGSPVVAGDVPGIALGKWFESDAFGAWLQTTYNHSILEMIGDFIRLRKLESSNRTLLDSQILFDGIGQYRDRIVKSGRFVGLAITVNTQEGLQAVINSLGMQADTVQDLTLYLYHSSVLEPLQTFDISVLKPSTFNWQVAPEPIVLKNYDALHGAGGVFYLGYFEDDLVGQAIRYDYNWGVGPCTTCGDYNILAFNRWSKFVKIASFSAPAAALDGTNLFNTDMVATGEGNYGLNISLTVGCDMTEFFGLHRHSFATALAQKIAIKLLERIAYSPRMTAIEDKSKALAFSDLQQKDENSFVTRYMEELKALSVDFSGLSSQCMPCADSRLKIKMGAV